MQVMELRNNEKGGIIEDKRTKIEMSEHRNKAQKEKIAGLAL